MAAGSLFWKHLATCTRLEIFESKHILCLFYFRSVESITYKVCGYILLVKNKYNMLLIYTRLNILVSININIWTVLLRRYKIIRILQTWTKNVYDNMSCFVSELHEKTEKIECFEFPLSERLSCEFFLPACSVTNSQHAGFVWNMEEGKSFSGSSDTNHDNSYIVKTLRLNCQFSLKARIYLWMIDCSVMLKIFLAWLVYTKYSYMHERKNCKITSNRCYFTYTYMYIYMYL